MDLYYSNEDVEILHGIVTYAQELLPTLPRLERLPTHALFKSYWDILPRHGVNPDHDSKYARVLFKIGGLRGPETLYEKFESVLSRMGIEIELDYDDDNDDINDDYDNNKNNNNSVHHEQESQGEQFGGSAEHTPSTREGSQQPQQRRRRNSESTIWELGNTPAQLRSRRNSFSTAPKARDLEEPRPEPLHELQFNAPSRHTTSHQQHTDNDPMDVVRPWLSSGMGKPSMRVHRAESDLTATTSAADDEDSMYSPKPLQEFTSDQVNSSLMDLKASRFHRKHLRSFAKQQVSAWRDKAIQSQEDNDALDLIATHHDRRALLKGALEDWRQQLYMKARAEESVAASEKFYAQLEERATQARKIKIMRTALTHWSVSAKVQAERTALARRHIVRTKVFGAWKGLAQNRTKSDENNEQTAKKQVMKKFLGAWKQRNVMKKNDEQIALQQHQANLMWKVYSAWNRKHQEVKAEAFLAVTTKKRAMFQLIAASHDRWEDQRTAEEARQLQIMRNTWRKWKAQTDEKIRQERAAEEYLRKKTASKFFKGLRCENRLAIAKKTIHTNQEERLKRDTLETWHHRSENERLATEVDRKKILQEAVTIWQHKNREKTIAERVNTRLMGTYLYKMVIAFRCKAKVGERETIIQSGIFLNWARNAREMKEKRLRKEEAARSFELRKAPNRLMRIWKSKQQDQQHLEHVAVGFRTTRLQEKAVAEWTGRSQHLEKLDRWATDARYYFLATTTMKKWKAATEASRREKRKQAYIKVRRMKKINLGRMVLQKWRDKARHVIDMKEQAQEVSHNKNVIVGMDLFDRWRAKTEEIADMEVVCKGTILAKHLVKWRERSNAVQEMNREAVMTYEENKQRRALKTWGLQNLQVKAQSNMAVEVRERNQRKAYRKVFNHWHSRTTEKPPDPPPDPGGSDFGGVSSIPGYLATPSRRRPNYSTTPREPIPTPFARKMRSAYGRSVVGKGGEFSDVGS